MSGIEIVDRPSSIGESGAVRRTKSSYERCSLLGSFDFSTPLIMPRSVQGQIANFTVSLPEPGTTTGGQRRSPTHPDVVPQVKDDALGYS